MVEIETRISISRCRTFGRIQWRVIPEPRATLQGERIPSAISTKSSAVAERPRALRIIEYFATLLKITQGHSK